LFTRDLESDPTTFPQVDCGFPFYYPPLGPVLIYLYIPLLNGTSDPVHSNNVLPRPLLVCIYLYMGDFLQRTFTAQEKMSLFASLPLRRRDKEAVEHVIYLVASKGGGRLPISV
jgi:hypothetical protein